MRIVLSLSQIFVSILLVFLVLIQAKGTGFGTSFNLGSSYQSKRGAEKMVFNLTIFVAVAFAALSILVLTVK